MLSEAKVCKPFVREAKVMDVVLLADDIREEDRKEIWHIARKTPQQAFMDGYHHSDTPFVIEYMGKPIAMFGVSGFKGDRGFPWMLGTNGINRIKKQFLRECRDHVEIMHQNYPILGNVVWSKNKTHIDWLKWLGFVFQESVQMGPDKELFIPFHKVKADV